MKREFSAGGIVFNNKGEVLVVQHSSHKGWSFPKGQIEPGKSSKETALREVKEEGGVDAEIIDKVGDSRYVYQMDGEKIFKVVTYFLMKYISGDTADHDWEVSDIGWFTPEEAFKQLTFSQDKDLLSIALEKLKLK